MKKTLKDEGRMEKEVVVKAPNKFKNAPTWKVFAEATETYLGQLLGRGRVPLRYVICHKELSQVLSFKLNRNRVVSP
jgi:hypothetical protein